MWSLEKNATPNLCAKMTIAFNDTQELKRREIDGLHASFLGL